MATEVYGPGAFCQTCGHFAARHSEDGCSGVDPKLGCRFGIKNGIQGTKAHPIKCEVFVWEDEEWPRPWLPAPLGKMTQDSEVSDNG